MGKFYYFQSPTFDIDPESDAAPRLGSIYSDLNQLTAPLNLYQNLSIPESLLTQSTVSDFSETRDSSFNLGAGLNSSIQGISTSLDLIYSFSREKKNTYSCDLLETHEFAPDARFVTDSIVASSQVQNVLSYNRIGRRRVYMITGLKIASGFCKSTAEETQQSPRLKLTASGAALGVRGLVDMGPELGITIAKGSNVAHGKTHNKIVFAYRVIKIRMKRDGEANYDHVSGGKYAVGDNDETREEENWMIGPLENNDWPQDMSPLYGYTVQVDVE